MINIYNFSVKQMDGNIQSLSRYKGKVLLIVNTATECGFTKQFGSLQNIYEKFKERDFEILAFPSNQFANQEPRDGEEISNFCKKNYGTTFQIFDKINVNGKNADPLFVYLQEKQTGLLRNKFIEWNFTKFLINKEGIPVQRFSSMTVPEKIEPEILKLLEQ